MTRVLNYFPPFIYTVRLVTGNSVIIPVGGARVLPREIIQGALMVHHPLHGLLRSYFGGLDFAQQVVEGVVVVAAPLDIGIGGQAVKDSEGVRAGKEFGEDGLQYGQIEAAQ